MALPDSIVDLSTRHQVYLEGLKAAEQKRVNEFLTAVARDIRKKMPDTVQGLTRKKLLELITRISKSTQKEIDGLIFDMLDEIEQLARYEADFTGAMLSEQIPDIAFNAPTVTQLKTAVFNNPMSIETAASDNLLRPFMRSFGPRTQNHIRSAIQLGYYQGESTPQVLRRLRQTLTGPINNDIRTTVRTGLQHSAMQSRAEVIAANDDIVDGVTWVSTLDGRTSQTCRSLDGNFYKHGEGPRPPIHPNCRSQVIPHFIKEYDFLNDRPTRISRDMTDQRKTKRIKAVKGDSTYYTWLKKQPAGVQKSILGGKRYKLFKDSGLSAEAFAKLQIGNNFQPLTLQQMARKDSASFKRAGIDINAL